jgi:hypothetical protein
MSSVTLRKLSSCGIQPLPKCGSLMPAGPADCRTSPEYPAAPCPACCVLCRCSCAQPPESAPPLSPHGRPNPSRVKAFQMLGRRTHTPIVTLHLCSVRKLNKLNGSPERTLSILSWFVIGTLGTGKCLPKGRKLQEATISTFHSM